MSQIVIFQAISPFLCLNPALSSHKLALSINGQSRATEAILKMASSEKNGHSPFLHGKNDHCPVEHTISRVV